MFQALTQRQPKGAANSTGGQFAKSKIADHTKTDTSLTLDEPALDETIRSPAEAYDLLNDPPTFNEECVVVERWNGAMEELAGCSTVSEIDERLVELGGFRSDNDIVFCPCKLNRGAYDLHWRVLGGQR